MKRIVRKIARDIKDIAKVNELDEVELTLELIAFLEEKKKKDIVKLYTKKKKISVLDVCKKYGISSKTFYQILKDNNIESDRKYPKSS
ncbi:hypothetical protein [Polaribacter sp. R77954]|uniref:hypothetical protein n=1 Tax=Polaribacter sp. R77954 TaxID=3093870 RepID=UPI0037C78086